MEVDILSSKPDIGTTDTKFLLTPNYMDVHEANPPHKHIALVYFALAKHNRHTLSSEHSDIQWLGENDLDRPQYHLSPSVKYYCRQAIKTASEH